MIDSAALRDFSKGKLLRDFSALVGNDQRQTARMIAYVGEIDRRKLYLEHAYPSMFAFCTGRFRMSEATAAKRIRAGRAACRFPCVLAMISNGELHLSGLHQLAKHLTEENHKEVLRRAKHRTMREIDVIIAELAPKPDVASSVRALPRREQPSAARPVIESSRAERALVTGAPVSSDRSVSKAEPPLPPQRVVPLAPRRYKLQVTIGEEARETLTELQALLSHQVLDGDPAAIVERAFAALLVQARKQRTAATDRPQKRRTAERQERGAESADQATKRGRAVPSAARREVFERDDGSCAFADERGRRCGSTWQIEVHHRLPFAKGGEHTAKNLELRCRAHNQYQAEMDYGALFMAGKRRQTPRRGAQNQSRLAEDV